MMDEQSSAQVFRWNIVLEYRPKTSRADEVYWEVYRDTVDQPLIYAGREVNLLDALQDVAGALDDDFRWKSDD